MVKYSRYWVKKKHSKNLPLLGRVVAIPLYICFSSPHEGKKLHVWCTEHKNGHSWHDCTNAQCAYRSWSPMLYLCRKLPPKTRESRGVKTPWIHPGIDDTENHKTASLWKCLSPVTCWYEESISGQNSAHVALVHFTAKEDFTLTGWWYPLLIQHQVHLSRGDKIENLFSLYRGRAGKCGNGEERNTSRTCGNHESYLEDMVPDWSATKVYVEVSIAVLDAHEAVLLHVWFWVRAGEEHIAFTNTAHKRDFPTTSHWDWQQMEYIQLRTQLKAVAHSFTRRKWANNTVSERFKYSHNASLSYEVPSMHTFMENSLNISQISTAVTN